MPRNTTIEEEARAEERAYKREWQRRNPEKVKEYHRRYWEKKARERREARAEQTTK